MALAYDAQTGGLVGAANKGDIYIFNSYNAGTISVASSTVGDFTALKAQDTHYRGLAGLYCNFHNSFIVKDSLINSEREESYQGVPLKMSDFEDGTLLKKLQGYDTTFTHFGSQEYHVDGSPWSQKIGTDKYPVLKEAGDAIEKKIVRPTQFQVAVNGNAISILGARVNTPFAVYDLNGKVYQRGTVSSANETVKIANAGLYVVRVGVTSQLVKIHGAK